MNTYIGCLIYTNICCCTWWCLCRWGKTTSLNCNQQRAYCSSPRWYMSMESHGGMISVGEDSWFVHQSFLESYQESHRQANQEELANENMNFAVRSIFVHTSKGSSCHKILRHGADDFSSLPKEGVLRIFIALKNFITLGRLSNRELWVQ
jgi:hypothetical protein